MKTYWMVWRYVLTETEEGWDVTDRWQIHHRLPLNLEVQDDGVVVTEDHVRQAFGLLPEIPFHWRVVQQPEGAVVVVTYTDGAPLGSMYCTTHQLSHYSIAGQASETCHDDQKDGLRGS